MINVFKLGRKEKSKASTANEPTSSFSLIQNIINRPNQYPHTLIETSTAHELMPSPSPSAPPKPDFDDVIVSASSSSETNQVRPSSSSLADTSALEHGASNTKEQSRISKTITIGQEHSYKQVCDFLTRREVGMVGIYGMGGVGKTTLLRRVRNEFMKRSNFTVIWIVVSAAVTKINIQKPIMGVLNLSFHEDEDTETRGIKINEALYDDKRSQIALLLDDIWEFIDLEELGVAGGLGLDSSRFKLVFTTRSEDVCLQMKPDKMIRINCLGPEDSWALFNRVVGEEILNSQRIVDLAREVADECGGLPLALTVVGKGMISKTCVGAWEDALNNLRSRPSLVSGTERDLYERLKFSYDNLENQVERDCFLFCCMYPEDEKISLSQLIDCWIGEGLFDVCRYDTYQETCNRGLTIVDTLVAKSLLETRVSEFPRCVTIHDVIRDMGLWIGSKRRLFAHTNGLKSQGKEIAEGGNGGPWAYVNVSIQELCCSELSVLHMEGHNSSTKLPSPLPLSFMHKLKVPMLGYLFRPLSFMHKLKVLIVRRVHWEWLESPPSTLGLLVELRHLEISYSDIKKLPGNMGNLSKLLVLQLKHNDQLTTLPATIGDLCELRKLQIRSSLLTSIPPELNKLSKLEIVEIHIVTGMVWLDNFDHFTKLRRLALHAKWLDGVLIYRNKLEVLLIKAEEERETTLMKGLVELPSLKLLLMSRWSIANVDELITALATMYQLRKLHIQHSPICKFVTPATTHGFLPQLESLCFAECPQLRKIHISEKALHSLEVLRINYCGSLEAVAGLQHLQQLRELSISAKETHVRLEERVVHEHCLLPDLNGVCFPNLQRLVVESLREMKCICNDDVVFPRLSVFELRDCPMLQKLPRGLMNVNRELKGEIEGGTDWWEGLDWEEDFKSYLLPLFGWRPRPGRLGTALYVNKMAMRFINAVEREVDEELTF